MKKASLLIFCALVCLGCNETTVRFAAFRHIHPPREYFGVPFGPSKMDILWVIDNGGSMCQEQSALRENFDRFIQPFQENPTDFHIGVTTTHAPASDIKQVFDPVAKEAVLSNVPQPVPGYSSECLAPRPIMASLGAALKCVRDPNIAKQFQWSDEQIECVINPPEEGCALLDVPDRNADGAVDIFDLFPNPDEYRTFPKVLKRKDYLNPDKSLDIKRLKQDFECISMVGTRGDSYKRGLQAAIKAVSPEWTGGIEGEDGADATKPNHGFIRKDAGFSLIFATNSNDCSAPDGAIPANNDCGPDACDFYNSSAIPAGESPLYKVEDLAKSFRDNLEKTKGRPFSDEELLVASIHGNWSRFSEPLPSNEQCRDLGRPGREVKVIACESDLGKARSGDRYERFIRQFANYYPNQVSKDDPLNFELHEEGLMCQGDFAPALDDIGKLLSNSEPWCILELDGCQSDQDCPAEPFTKTPGRCLTGEGSANGAAFNYSMCDHKITYRIMLVDKQNATFPVLEEHPYCMPESIGKVGADSCLVKPELYGFEPSKTMRCFKPQFIYPYQQVERDLKGYHFWFVYR